MKNKLSILTATLNIAAVSLAILAWSQQTEQKPKPIAISILLALCAFVLMWVHYVSDWCRKKWFTDQTAGWQYSASRWFVFIAILSHPVIINGYLIQNDYGLPPNGYQNYYGKAVLPFIVLGIISLIAFLSFELKKWLKGKPIWQAIIHFNNLAMLLIIVHGFKLGPVTESSWYFWVWSLQAIILCLIIGSNYMEQKINTLKYIGVTVAFAGLLTSGWFIAKKITDSPNSVNINTNTTSLVSTPTSSDQSTTATNSQQTSSISVSDLAKNNGLDGAKCWVAVNGVVYDASSNSQWRNGQHTPSRGQAKCGEDLTNVITRSPHGTDVLSNIPVIGNLQ